MRHGSQGWTKLPRWMEPRLPWLLSATFLFVALTVSQVVGQSTLSGKIEIDGSSTVYPITEAVAEEFGKVAPRVRVTVGISGTGGGFKRFSAGETDISDASRPIKQTEHDACKAKGIQYIELPIAYDALTVVINPNNTWASSMTVAELKKLWEPAAQGKITRWNQIRPNWPNQPIRLFGPGPDSGTFEYFTEAVVGEAKKSRGDFTASEDDNVLVQGVANDRYALGYFGMAYYLENRSRLKAVGIDAGKGPQMPTPQAVISGTYQPLSRPLFIYVKRQSADRPEVRAFVEFYLKNAAKLVKEVGYVPLPARAYQAALKRFQARKIGSVFGLGGATVGVKMEQLLAKEGVQ